LGDRRAGAGSFERASPNLIEGDERQGGRNGKEAQSEEGQGQKEQGEVRQTPRESRAGAKEEGQGRSKKSGQEIGQEASQETHQEISTESSQSGKAEARTAPQGRDQHAAARNHAAARADGDRTRRNADDATADAVPVIDAGGQSAVVA
jgi:hypothetical protein